MLTSPFKRNIQPGLININIPITRGKTSCFASTISTAQAAKNNLRCLLLTNKGERVLSDFGTSIRELIFDPADETIESNIIEEVKRSVNQWLPYIKVKETKVTFDAIQNRFSIFIRFILTENNYEDTLEILVP